MRVLPVGDDIEGVARWLLAGSGRLQDRPVLLRLPYLALTSVFTLIRLLPMGDRDKDAEILALRHQLAVLQPEFRSWWACG